MAEDKLDRVLPLMFRQVKSRRHAKDELRKRLFGKTELFDDNLLYIAAAGDIIDPEQLKHSCIE